MPTLRSIMKRIHLFKKGFMIYLRFLILLTINYPNPFSAILEDFFVQLGSKLIKKWRFKYHFHTFRIFGKFFFYSIQSKSFLILDY